MNTQYKGERKMMKKYQWTKLLWFKMIFMNLVSMFVLAGIFHALGSYSPFRYAIIMSIGIFSFSIMIVSNVKRAKPWSRFRWE